MPTGMPLVVKDPFVSPERGGKGGCFQELPSLPNVLIAYLTTKAFRFSKRATIIWTFQNKCIFLQTERDRKG
jgi:hypothetical protein